ncbi:MAG: acyl carrier protein [Bacilli bacterium]|nr:acyl carrier protein [Bacilli bacterium]MDD7315049.1 acyl carrier protein [Bacilli bacterium]MDY4053049.1 acyl carrier protein [Bacilli bacterium]
MVLETVAAIIAKELNKKAEDIKMETRLVEDLGADSLDAVEIMFALEEKFGLEIDDDAALQMKTVGDLVNYIEAHK